MIKIRHFFSSLLILPLFWSCESSIHEDVSLEIKDKLENDLETKNGEFQEVNQDSIDWLTLDFCHELSLEVIDFYPILDSIASDKYENLILVDLMKNKGFEVIEWGRGNFMEGPRIVSFTLSNGECECQVGKIYFSTEREGEYRVTERIECGKEGF